MNVLLANDIKAIRIDENRMEVFGLTDDGEVKVPLNPNSRNEQYLKRVREMISGHVMGSPGGYPVFLQRWTRMGQTRNENLAELLLLGEPEAVVAVVHAPGLTPELARRAWWAMPEPENARRMLENAEVAQSDLGKELAHYLIEYLPFETEPGDIIDSVRLILQPGLISEAQKNKIWERGTRKNVFYVGFLYAVPDDLPHPGVARHDFEKYRDELSRLSASGNLLARVLMKVLDSPGQTFLQTVAAVLKKPSHQEVVVSVLNTIGNYCSAFCSEQIIADDMEAIVSQAGQQCEGCQNHDNEFARQLVQLLEAVPELRPEITALLALASVREHLVSDTFARSTAIGSLMRQKIEPITGPLSNLLAILLGVTI